MNEKLDTSSLLINKEQFYRYTGDVSQICGIKEYELKSGKGKGVMAFDVKNGAGLQYTVLADRCLDISDLMFNGVNFSYLSKTGVTAPTYNESGSNFFQNFFAGFLTTCGLRNVGNACEDNGESFGVHGRIANLPAEEVSATVNWIDNMPEMNISGKVREASFFGENIILERSITCRYGTNSIKINNTIENLGFKPEIVMFLLHFNVGFPLLSPYSQFLSPSEKVIPRDPDAAIGIGDYNQMQPPTKNYKEQVFYHTLRGDVDDNTTVAFINPEIEMGVSIRFNKKQFPCFTQWKQMGEGEYVMGMEPCNCYVGGRLDARNKGILTYLQPFEKRKFDLVVDLYSGSEQLDILKNLINGY